MASNLMEPLKSLRLSATAVMKGWVWEFIKIRVPVTSPMMTSPLSNQLFAPEQVPLQLRPAAVRGIFLPPAGAVDVPIPPAGSLNSKAFVLNLNIRLSLITFFDSLRRLRPIEAWRGLTGMRHLPVRLQPETARGFGRYVRLRPSSSNKAPCFRFGCRPPRF